MDKMVGSSLTVCEEDIKNWFAKFPKHTKFIDVGCGAGKYGKMLKSMGYECVDGIEIYEPYIKKYNVNSKYRNIYIMDVMKFDKWNEYDVCIFGDVIEHLSIKDSQILIENLKTMNMKIFIQIPFMLGQKQQFGNKWEQHIQKDINLEVFNERYKDFQLLAKETKNNIEIGVFVHG
jgi:site-specific DNA-cytosine methylase